MDNRKVIFLLTARHTGTNLVAELLRQIPEIMIITFGSNSLAQYADRQFPWDSFFNEPGIQNPSNPKFNLSDKIIDDLLRSFPIDYKYGVWQHHPPTPVWLDLLLRFRPSTYIVISTIRNPYLKLRSHAIRGNRGIEIADYLYVIDILRTVENKIILQIDVLQNMEEEERVNSVIEALTSQLDININDKLISFIKRWPKVNSVGNNRDMTDEEFDEINKTIESSCVLEFLKELGFDYENTIHK